MDGCFRILTRKYSNVGAQETTEQEFYLRRKILIEKIELLCSLIETNAKLIPLEKEIIWNNELCDFEKNIEKVKLEMTQSEILLQNENSNLNQFRRNVELNWRTTKFAKKNIEENLKQKIKIRTAEFSSMLLVSNLKNKARKKSIETEIEWFNLRLKSLDEIYCLRMNALCHERYRMRKRHLDQFEKYDKNIGSLYACKVSLLLKKNYTNEEYIIIQENLLTGSTSYPT
ncbi:uncharacterized protein LOC122528153 isoform X2 [Frieseomelitta varia]|uniref:uncharacterized protein LOC122528153 isoform X2 n=1 Tax=Frieseomelitta varia TaxID=561572 RepID=UPI001CB694E5|nr:uncharacterized protein LOC122528153 isoform X2 [Frieseomelitta varia]